MDFITILNSIFYFFLHWGVVQGGGDSAFVTVPARITTVSTFKNIPQHSLQSASFYFGGVVVQHKHTFNTDHIKLIKMKKQSP